MQQAVPPTTTIGQEIGGRGKTYFDSIVIDNLMDAFIELAAEVWTTRDRLFILESVLAERDIDAAALIEAHVPPDSVKAERKAAREAFIGQVFASFLRRPDTGEQP
jgi:hypothetical protein